MSWDACCGVAIDSVSGWRQADLSHHRSACEVDDGRQLLVERCNSPLHCGRHVRASTAKGAESLLQAQAELRVEVPQAPRLVCHAASGRRSHADGKATAGVSKARTLCQQTLITMLAALQT